VHKNLPTFLRRDAMRISAVFAVARCLSVYPSIRLSDVRLSDTFVCRQLKISSNFIFGP